MSWKKMIDRSFQTFKEEEEKQDKQGNLSSIVNRAEHKLDVANEKGVKRELSPNNQLVDIHGCTACEYVITSRSSKILIANCEDISLTIGATVISGMLEIVRCKRMEILCKMDVPTVQVDISESITVTYEKEGSFEQLVSAQCKDLKVKLPQRDLYRVPVDTADMNDWEWKEVQFRTRFQDENGNRTLNTEPIIRNDRGFILPNQSEREQEIDKLETLLDKTTQDLTRVEGLRDTGGKGYDSVISERKENIRQLKEVIDQKKEELVKQQQNVQLAVQLKNEGASTTSSIFSTSPAKSSGSSSSTQTTSQQTQSSKEEKPE